LLPPLEELRLSRVFGSFCDAGDVELMMLLCGALGTGLRHLDLEGFPRLSDGGLLEMLSATRGGPSDASAGDAPRGLEVLRLLGTKVSDAAFVNGLDEALAPSLRELRLSGGRGVGDGSLQCLAEAGRCRELERLAIGGPGFSDVGLMAVLTGGGCSLRALHLKDTLVTDEMLIDIAAAATELRDLTISGGCARAVTDRGLVALARLPLASLRLSSCPGLSNWGVAEALEVLRPRLTSLSLEHCAGLGNPCLAGLAAGERWRLQHVRIIGLGLAFSGKVLNWCDDQTLPDLRRLDLWRAKCSPAAEADFKRLRPEVILVLRDQATLSWANW